MSLCGFDQGKNYADTAIIDRPKQQSGWIMGARKCQTIEDTIDDRGPTCRGLRVEFPTLQEPEWRDHTGQTMHMNEQISKRYYTPGWCPKNVGHTCLMKGLVYSARSKAHSTTYPVNGVSDAVACQKLCEFNRRCNYFTFHSNGACYLMKTIKSISSSGARAQPYTSGYKRCAQGEYGATWDRTKFYLFENRARYLGVDTFHGVANTELCQKLCISRSIHYCEAWTFNFQTHKCLLYRCYGGGGFHRSCLPTKASFVERKGSSLEDTPWVSGPRNIW